MKETSVMHELFLHMKPVQILIALNSNNENYASTIAKMVDCTYSHTMKILDIFFDNDIVSFEKKGRVKFVCLTERGKNIAKEFERITSKL